MIQIFNISSKTGGEKEVTLTVEQNAKTQTRYNTSCMEPDDNTDLLHYENQTQGSTSMFKTDYAGGGQAHNNMPPLLQCFIFVRTA